MSARTDYAAAVRATNRAAVARMRREYSSTAAALRARAARQPHAAAALEARAAECTRLAAAGDDELLAAATRAAIRELVGRRAGVLPTAAALVAGDAVAVGAPAKLRARTLEASDAQPEGGRA